jgi:hypothetical protein
MKRLSNPFVRLSASLLVALALFTGVGCNEGSNVADNTAQRPAIAQQAVDHMKADWSHLPQFLQDAIAIQEANEASLLSIDGVNGVGVGQGEDGAARLIVFTEREGVNGIPAQVRNIKVRVEHIGTVTPMGKPAPNPYKKTYLPGTVPCGVSIGHNDECSAGTLGAVVKNPTSGQRLLLTNWHVASGPLHTVGGRMDQSGRLDASSGQCGASPAIGTTSYLNPLSVNVFDTNIVDAGLITIASGVTVSRNMADGSTPSTTTVAPVVGMSVRKVGRTSGVTTSTIAGINVTIKVNYGSYGTANFKKQIYMANGKFIQSGDSGSLMTKGTKNSSGTYDVVGLCFAGSSTACFANPIDDVLSACGVVLADN